MSSSSTPERPAAGSSREPTVRRFGIHVVVALGLVGAGVLSAAVPDGAQLQTSQGQRRCDLMENQFVRSIVTGDGNRITYISGPVLFVCQDSTRIRADSAVEFSEDQFRELIGHVDIDGPETRVQAERVHLFNESGRIQAWGNVRVTARESDTRMVGDTMVFLQGGNGRTEDRLRMWGGGPYAVLRLEGEEAPDTTPKSKGPTVVVIGGPEPEAPPVDTAPQKPAQPPPPDTVFADRLYMRGRTRFLAGGSVRVARPDLTAVGDSLDYDRELGRADLLGTDSVPAGIDGDQYALNGRTLSLLIQGSRVSRVDARHRARLDGQDVRVQAPRIAVFLAGGGIDRMVAVKALEGQDGDVAAATPTTEDSAGVVREPEATARDFFLRADSIEVQAPGQRLDQVVAVGSARGETRGRDSLNTPDTPELIRQDWIEGDTVRAHFVQGDSGTVAAESQRADTAEARNRLDRLVASGHARSLYRVAPDSAASDSTAEVAPDSTEPAPASDTTRAGAPGGAEAEKEPPRPRRRLAVHYVVGDRITIMLREGEVQRMQVEGQTRGLYLEPGEASPPPVVQQDSMAARGGA